MKRIIPMVMLVLCLTVTAKATDIAGVMLAEEITQSNGTVLPLNGAGIRSKFFFKIYVGALYLENKSSDAQEVISMEGGKQIYLHFLYNEVGKDDLVEAWSDGFQANGSPVQLSDLAQQIDSYNALFDTVKSGDVITLDYQPEAGTSVTIRNEKKGTIPGKPFNDLLLSIWLGQKPVTEDLRDELLGK